VTKVSTHAWFNGSIVPLEAGAPSIASINFHLGTSVFDGLIAYCNNGHYYLHRAEEHLTRFRQGAARMGLEVRWSVAELLDGVVNLLGQEPASTQYIRPIAYRRIPELWVTGSEGKPVDVSIFTVRIERDTDAAITCHVSPVERISSRSIPARTKVSGAYVNSFNARRTAELSGFQDGLMLDREGRIAEASAANFFAVDGGRLLTPLLNVDVFPGITREVVIELARDVGIEVFERDMHPQDLQRLCGAFLCSTLMELRPLSRIGDVPLDTTSNAMFQALLQRFRMVTHQTTDLLSAMPSV
jgi:branched-chain amino acid aminotransferase